MIKMREAARGKEREEREKRERDRMLVAEVRKKEGIWLAVREEVRACEWGILVLEADVSRLLSFFFSTFVGNDFLFWGRCVLTFRPHCLCWFIFLCYEVSR